APSLSITRSAGTLKAGENATITFTFSEDPGASFTDDDIVVTGGTLGALSGTGTTRTAVFTPQADAAGSATISVAGGSYSDLAGNAGAGAAAPAIAFDTQAPTLTISADRGALKAGETATITFTFSEDPGASFTGGDVTVSGGTLGALSGSGTTRTAVFTPAAATNGGTASITVAGGSYTDAAGNPGAAGASPGLVFDTLAPAAPSAPDLAVASDSGTSDSDNTTNATSLAFSGTAEADALVTLYDGASAIGTATAGGDGTWNVLATGLAEGTHTLSARATDAAGNSSAASASLAVVVDRTAPVLTIASDKAALKAGDTATVTFTFSEDPGTSFAAGDIQVSGGSLGALSGTGNTRTAVFTPAAGGSGTASISVAGGAYLDAAGNAGASDSALALVFDTLAPTVSISSDRAALNASQSATITFTFSEDPGASFTSADIAVTNGTLGPLSGSGTVRSALFTPGAGVTGNASVSVAAGSYVDGAGNAGTAGTVTVAVDTLAPAAPSTPDLSAASDLGASDSDNLTSAATALFTGTAEDGATVRLYDGDTLVGTGTASGGAWAITTSPLSDGAHAIKA
ncbi:MAG TPA: Ig-like domain-containing protein, partial [Telluria sp.]|nr:Ig-like domain-containing protein [Telluria sp.]